MTFFLTWYRRLRYTISTLDTANYHQTGNNDIYINTEIADFVVSVITVNGENVYFIQNIQINIPYTQRVYKWTKFFNCRIERIFPNRSTLAILPNDEKVWFFIPKGKRCAVGDIVNLRGFVDSITEKGISIQRLTNIDRLHKPCNTSAPYLIETKMTKITEQELCQIIKESVIKILHEKIGLVV